MFIVFPVVSHRAHPDLEAPAPRSEVKDVTRSECHAMCLAQVTCVGYGYRYSAMSAVRA